MPTHREFGKNFDPALLELEADRRGFIVGQSRLGITKLRSSLGVWVDVLGGYTSIAVRLACRVVDGAWVEPEVSTLSLATRDRDVFAVTDGDELHLIYDSATVFEGYVAESTLTSELDEDGKEEFTVVLQARGYEGIKNGQPAIGTVTTLWSLGGGGGPVIQWDAGKVRDRAADVTGRAVLVEDDRADIQLEERVGVESDVTGTQGELLADLAIRAGLLLDQSSGTAVTFRSYQGAPRWALEDEHVVSGYQIAVDRQSTSAVVVTRKEDEGFVRSYRAGGQRVTATREISTVAPNEWDMSSVPAYTPLVARPRAYLASARVPRSDDLALPSRLPILASYRHGGATYEGAVVGMTHSIGKDRWMIDLTCEPGQLVTRESQLNPSAPDHVRISLNAGTATLAWSDDTLGVAQGTPLLASYFTVASSAVPDVTVGDELRVYEDDGVTEKEDTVFAVTAISAPAFGFINITVSPAPVVKIVQNDVIKYAHHGPVPIGWVVWYQRILAGFDNRAISPNSTGFAPQSKVVYEPVAAITGLTSGVDYRFTVYAFGAEPNIRSAPSDWVSTSTVAAEGLELITSNVTASTVDLDWTWTGATLTGFKVGRDGVDSTGFGAYETILDPADLDLTFDKLLGTTTYHVFVAAMVGTVEVERVTAEITTDTVVVGPPDPGNPGAVIPLVGISGLGHNSIVFTGGGSVASANSFGNSRARPMDGLMFFPPRQTWADLNSHSSDHAQWLQSGHILVTSIPHAPNAVGSSMNTQGANNAFVSQQRALGASLVSQGLNHALHAIRVDWECNGNWYNWSIQNGGSGALKLALINFVTNVRAGGATNVKFDLCFNKGPSQAGADFAAFPGAEYIDIIAVDAYDQWQPTFTDGNWTTEINRTPGLQTVRNFAVAQGIQFALDEGGNAHPADGNHGGDNPFYWEKMWEFFTDPLNVPYAAWHTTYNHDGAPDTLHHTFDPWNPNSFAVYSDSTRWGGL
jgi:hypothetical protein